MPAAFLDRDGVLIRNPRPRGRFILRPDEVFLLPGAAAGLRRLADAGYAAYVVTNQVIVGQGAIAEADLESQHEMMKRLLAAQGARVDGVYAATHEHGPRADWVKPGPGMILAAARERGLDLAASVLFGDKVKDLEAARAAGVAAVWVSGDVYEGEPERVRAFGPHAEGRTLSDAVEAWLACAAAARTGRPAAGAGAGQGRAP